MTKSTGVIEVLMWLENGIFEVILEAEKETTLVSYFATLENLNKYARLNSSEITLLWVRERLQYGMDLICTFYDLPGEVFEYGSSGTTIGELGFSLFRFD